MAKNNRAPAYIKLVYTGTLFNHHQYLQVKPDGAMVPGTSPLLLKVNDETIDWKAGLDAYLDAVKLSLPSTLVFSYAEIHAFDPEAEFPDTFIDAYVIDSVAGSIATARIPASQAMWICKTVGGQRLALQFMETHYSTPQNFDASIVDPPIIGIFDYMLSEASIVYGYDNTPALVSQRWRTRINDKLAKRLGL